MNEKQEEIKPGFVDMLKPDPRYNWEQRAAAYIDRVAAKTFGKDLWEHTFYLLLQKGETVEKAIEGAEAVTESYRKRFLAEETAPA